MPRVRRRRSTTEHGTMDEPLTPDEVDQLERLLRRARASVRLLPAAIGYRLDDALTVLPMLETLK